MSNMPSSSSRQSRKHGRRAAAACGRRCLDVSIMKEITVGVVRCKGKLLILKRQKNKTYDPDRWEFVSGFIKKSRSLAEQAAEQVSFETGLKPVLEKEGDVFEVKDEYGKWIIHPFLFSVESSQVKIRKEDHSEYKWADIEELDRLECVKDLDKNLVALGL